MFLLLLFSVALQLFLFLLLSIYFRCPCIPFECCIFARFSTATSSRVKTTAFTYHDYTLKFELQTVLHTFRLGSFNLICQKNVAQSAHTHSKLKKRKLGHLSNALDTKQYSSSNGMVISEISFCLTRTPQTFMRKIVHELSHILGKNLLMMRLQQQSNAIPLGDANFLTHPPCPFWIVETWEIRKICYVVDGPFGLVEPITKIFRVRTFSFHCVIKHSLKWMEILRMVWRIVNELKLHSLWLQCNHIRSHAFMDKCSNQPSEHQHETMSECKFCTRRIHSTMRRRYSYLYIPFNSVFAIVQLQSSAFQQCKLTQCSWIRDQVIVLYYHFIIQITQFWVSRAFGPKYLAPSKPIWWYHSESCTLRSFCQVNDLLHITNGYKAYAQITLPICKCMGKVCALCILVCSFSVTVLQMQWGQSKICM